MWPHTLNFIQECVSVALSVLSVFLYLQLPLLVFDSVCVGLRVRSVGVTLRMKICRWDMRENPCLGIIGDFS